VSKKYRFRKVYFIVPDNSVFGKGYELVNCYRKEQHVKKICVQQQRIANDEATKWWAKSQKIPILKVEGFYLVHESLFEEILEMWCKQEIKE